MWLVVGQLDHAQKTVPLFAEAVHARWWCRETACPYIYRAASRANYTASGGITTAKVACLVHSQHWSGRPSTAHHALSTDKLSAN